MSAKAAQTLMEFSAADRLSCDNYPSFERLNPLLDNMRNFSNIILSTKGGFYEVCNLTWPPLKRGLLSGLWNATSSLEEEAGSQISWVIITKVVEAVGAAYSVGV